MKFLIQPRELRDLLSDRRILLVDARNFTEYMAGHIPGSINVDLFQFHWADTTEIGMKQFERQLRLLLSRIGVSKEKHVIFYENISGMAAARGIWLLLYLSHEKVSLLDGGFEMWKKNGYPIENKTNPFILSNFVGKVNHNVLVTFQELQKSLNKKHTVIIDARTQQEYSGYYVRASRSGHIPGAINIDWKENTEKGLFKNTKKLSKVYSNIPRRSEVITYCQGGYRAANSFLALKLLGYSKVRMYLGSWGEWANRPELSVEQS